MNRLFILALVILAVAGVLNAAEPPSANQGDITMSRSVTFKGTPLTLLGKEIKAGDPAPDFVLLGNDLRPVKLADTKGVRVFVTVPSLDTPVCDLEVRRFNTEAAKLPNVSIYAISADLPFAQARWCGAAEVKTVRSLSDHRDLAFADAYGVHIKELRLLARAVFVIDSTGKVVYHELVKEIADQPDFGKALEAIQKAR